MLNEIKAINCSLAKDLYKSLRKRIEERRTVHSPPLDFHRSSNTETDFDKDYVFQNLPKKILYHPTTR